MNHFNIGNKKTLRDDPIKKGINVREELVKFYEKYYSANLMKLVILGKETLEKLENYVRELFEPVPNRNSPPTYVHPHPAGPPFTLDKADSSKSNLMKFIYVVPVKDLRRLDIMWMLDLQRTRIIC